MESINLNHYGKGDNVARDKIVKVYLLRAAIALFFLSSISIMAYKKSEAIMHYLGMDKVFEIEDARFKVLILPFDIQCNNVPNKDVGAEIKRRLDILKRQDSLNIYPYYLDIAMSPNFDRDSAEALQKHHNADLIIYGSFNDEKCSEVDGGNEICYNWITDEKWDLGDGLRFNPLIDDGNQIASINDIRQGKVQGDTDYIIYWIAGLSEYSQLNYNNARKHWTHIYDSLNIHRFRLLYHLGKTGLKTGDYPAAKNFFEDALPMADNFRDSVTAITYTAITCLKLSETEQANRYLEEAIRCYQEQPILDLASKSNMAITYQYLGDSYSSAGDLDKALTAYRTYNRLGKELLEQYPQELNVKDILAISYEYLGKTYSALGQLDSALIFFQEYNRLEKELFDAQVEDTEFNAKFRNGLAVSFQFLGNTYTSLGELDHALTHYEAQHKLLQELHRTHPEAIDFKSGLAISFQNLGNTHASLGNMDKALAYFKKFNQLNKELSIAHPESVKAKNELAISEQFLGNFYADLGKLDSALIFHLEYNRIEKELHKQFPDNIEYKNNLGVSYEAIGYDYTLMEDYATALTFFEQEMNIFKELTITSPKNTNYKNGLAFSYQFLGNTYQKLENFDMALHFFTQYNLLEKVLSETVPQNANFKNSLAISHWLLGTLYQNNDDNEMAQLNFQEAKNQWTELTEACNCETYQDYLNL